MKLIHTDNLGRDFPDEKFVDFGGLYIDEDKLDAIADILNGSLNGTTGDGRYWRVVPDDYKLQGGFEP